ncbi:MAG: hypothetical protein ACRYF3_09060 [Janthinobacterium lividum]
MSAAKNSPEAPRRSGGVDLRVPIGWRVYVAVFGVAWIALCIVFGLLAWRSQPGSIVVVVIMAVFGEVICVRTWRARAFTDGDVLVVRNVLSSRRLDRAALRSVQVGRPTGNPAQLGRIVSVLDRSGGVHTIDASMRTAFTPAGRQALAEQRDALEAWRQGPRRSRR